MTALWMAGLLGSALLAGLMAANGAWKRWPSLFAYLTMIVAQSLVCWALWDSHSYFYAYYGFQILCHASEVWVIAQVLLHVVGVTPRVRRWILRALPAVLVTGVSAGVYLSFTAGTAMRYGWLVYAAKQSDLAICMGWVVTFLLACISSKLFAEFSGGTRGIAVGFLVECCANEITALRTTHNAPTIPLFQDVVYLAVLSVWAVSLRAVPYRRVVVCHAADYVRQAGRL